METDQRLLISEDMTHTALCDDFTLKHISANVTFVDDLESGCHTFTEIELTMAPNCQSHDDLIFARLETNATVNSGSSCQEGNLLTTPVLSDDTVKSAIEEISAGWKKLILVAKSIHRFRSLKVERISSQSGLVSSIVNAPRAKSTFAGSEDDMYITMGQLEAYNLGLFRDQLSFYKAVEVGSDKDLIFIRDMLGNDPKANFYEAGNVERLANKPDHRGYSPLYIACRNGNLEVVKLLIQFQANPYQVCKVTAKENESIISVAARWSHIELIKYLISDCFAWEEVELRKAYNSTDGIEIKKLISALLTPEARTCWNTIFPCLSTFL